jgi:hypothetical protein
MPPGSRSSAELRCGSGSGSPSGRWNAGTRKGARTSIVTIQGEMVVAKLSARKEGFGSENRLRGDWRIQPSSRVLDRACHPKKEMVPSDPISQPNSPPACNGTELCSQNRRAPSLQLPAAFLRKQRINASRLTCQLFWPEPVSRSGLSLSRNDCPSPGHHFEVKAPDLLLRHPAVRSSCPFRFRFPHALRFAPMRAGSLPKSRCLTPVRHSQPFLGSPLPFGAFRTLKDQSVQPDSWLGSSPSERSRLPITPRHRFYFISSDARSPLRAR